MKEACETGEATGGNTHPQQTTVFECEPGPSPIEALQCKHLGYRLNLPASLSRYRNILDGDSDPSPVLGPRQFQFNDNLAIGCLYLIANFRHRPSVLSGLVNYAMHCRIGQFEYLIPIG